MDDGLYEPLDDKMKPNIQATGKPFTDTTYENSTTTAVDTGKYPLMFPACHAFVLKNLVQRKKNKRMSMNCHNYNNYTLDKHFFLLFETNIIELLIVSVIISFRNTQDSFTQSLEWICCSITHYKV